MEVVSISCGLWLDVCRHSCSLGSDCPGQREHLATLHHRLSSGRMSFKMVACGLVPRNLRVASHARLSHLAYISAVSRVVRRAINHALQMLKRCFRWNVSRRRDTVYQASGLESSFMLCSKDFGRVRSIHQLVAAIPHVWCAESKMSPRFQPDILVSACTLPCLWSSSEANHNLFH